MRVHQDFTANVLRGGKPHIVKNVKEEIERDLSLDEFRYWTAIVRLAALPHTFHFCKFALDLGGQYSWLAREQGHIGALPPHCFLQLQLTLMDPKLGSVNIVPTEALRCECV